MDRVIAYIDGFNLYFGMKKRKYRKFYWLNLQKLIENFLKPGQQLESVKYFTTKIVQPPDKAKRQQAYLKALSTLPKLEIIYGRYSKDTRICHICGKSYNVYNEKMTDVNIAVEIIKDAMQEKYDTAFLVTGDADLTGAVRMVREEFPEKNILALFPPERYSHALADISHKFLNIGHGRLARSVFPSQVRLPNGFTIDCPVEWMRPTETPKS